MTPEMATIDRLDVALQILPLLSGEIAIDRFILEKPVINLEVDEQGRPNWQLGTAEAAPAHSGDAGGGDAGGAPAVGDLRLGEVWLVDGVLNFVNRQIGQEVTRNAINMKMTLPQLSWHVTTTWSAVGSREQDEPEAVSG